MAIILLPSETATGDPTVAITARGVELDLTPYVDYRNEAGERWRIRSTCNLCGECEVGAVYPEGQSVTFTGLPIGTAGACVDPTYPDRADIPVRPGIAQDHANCVLSGEYL